MRIGEIKGLNGGQPSFHAYLSGLSVFRVKEILWAVLALVLHEAGHALAALICGLRLLRVELFPLVGDLN